MELVVVKEGGCQALEAQLHNLLAKDEITAVMVLISSECQVPVAQLGTMVQTMEKPLFGGFFPGIIADNQLLSHGAILYGFTSPVSVVVLQDLDAASIDQMEGHLVDALGLSDTHRQTLFTFVDGLSPHVNQLVQGLFNEFGLEINYIGGGCGNRALLSAPCVITPQGLLTSAAVLALADCNSGIGVAHGWQSVTGAFKVTEADCNRILSLDWQPAFSLYRQQVALHAGTDLTRDNFLEMAKSYPFGVSRLGDEMVIRDPIAHEGETLVCVGEVRRGAFVHIMHGEADNLIAAAHRAGERAALALKGAIPQHLFLVTCVSRHQFLGEQFELELSEVQKQGIPVFGILSLGEIANSGQDYLELFNKTVVIGLLADES